MFIVIPEISFLYIRHLNRKLESIVIVVIIVIVVSTPSAVIIVSGLFDVIIPRPLDQLSEDAVRRCRVLLQVPYPYFVGVNIIRRVFIVIVIDGDTVRPFKNETTKHRVLLFHSD